MCEYQRIKENQMPMCEYTKTWCTYCVLGNGKTYKEAKTDGSRKYVGGFLLLDRETYEKMKGGENDAERKTD